MLDTKDVIEAYHTDADVAAAELDHEVWQSATPVRLTRYWSGEEAPAARHAEARIVWSRSAISVRFVCRQDEPLIVNATPQTESKTIGLWERDVCEIFIATDPSAPEHYFEFEAAPTGEWLDLSIIQRADARETLWEFNSGMTAAARISADQILIAMRIPWAALGRLPDEGERWRANLFRCVGTGDERGYLAWRPTRTPRPNFHVPQAFGEIEFKDEG
ncbi:MAG TPA: carbohydrate-binding family 9-like protein [Pyrinomonadaceae bacterium]